MLLFLLALRPGAALAQDYVVQVSSLSTLEAAQTEAQRLLGQGVPSFQRSEEIPERGIVHRVYLGPFSSRAEAQAAAEALKTAGVVKDYILRTDGGTTGTPAGPAASAPAVAPPQGGTDSGPAEPFDPEAASGPPPEAFDPETPVLQAPAAATPQVPQAQVPGGAYGPAPTLGPGGEAWAPPLPPQAPVQQPAADDAWGGPPAVPGTVGGSAPPRAVAPGETVYWTEGGGDAAAAAAEGWPPPPPQAPAAVPPVGQAPAAVPPVGQAPAAEGWPPPPPRAPATQQPSAEGWPPPPPQAPAPKPDDWGQAPAVPVPPSAPGAVPPVAIAPPAAPPTAVASSATPPNTVVLPAEPPVSAPAAAVPGAVPPVAAVPAAVMTGSPQPDAWDGKANSFTALVDLSSSMLWLSPCRGGLVKAEAESALLRKISQRLPNRPYIAALRVFGYQQAWREADFTTLYYGPTAYESDGFDRAVARLAPANAVSPFGVALRATAEELAALPSPRAVLMFSDFEVTSDPGDPPQESGRLRGRFGGDTRVYAFFVTKDRKAKTLAANVAASGGGQSFDVCAMLGDEAAFEAMMDEIFGPKEEPPCADSDGDGVCDVQDQCPSTPKGAPVDSRGCWIAAYSQFFDFDKAVVKSAFLPRLQYAAEIIRNNPQIGEIIIAGHTDDKGTDSYNMDLGRRRAQAVMDVLVKNGAPAERMKVESFGKTRPVAENTTEEGRARNRRVEFHVGDVPPAA